ncbi:hypothetical protein ABPG72_020995 [Tetrahymena utriculariae]
MGDNLQYGFGPITVTVADSDDDQNYNSDKEEECLQHNNIEMEAQKSTQNDQITMKSTQKKTSSIENNPNNLDKLIKSENIDFSLYKQNDQLLYHIMSNQFDDVRTYFEENKDSYQANNIFISVILWILEQAEEIKALKEQNTKKKDDEYIEKVNKINQNINKYLNFVKENLNHDSVKIESESKGLVTFLIQKLKIFKSIYIELSIFQWIYLYQQFFDPNLNYIIARHLIRLNQLEIAEYYVEQAFIYLEKQTKLRDLFVILLFKCHRDQEIIMKEFNDRKKMFDEKKQQDLEYLLFCFEFLKCLKRIGNVELVRKNFYLLGSQQIKDFHQIFYEENLAELYDLVIFTNRLPYVLKLMEKGKDFDANQNIDIQMLENDPRDLIIELNACLLQKINQPGYQQPYLIIYHSLLFGQDYESLQENVKKIYATDIITKIEKKEKKANKQIHKFTEKEYQIIKPYLYKYYQDIHTVNQELLEETKKEIPYTEKQDKQNYFNLLMTLKRCGQYKDVVNLIDDGPILQIDQYDEDYLSLFKFLSLSQNNSQINTQEEEIIQEKLKKIQEVIPIILKSLCFKKDQLQNIKITFKDSYKRVLKNLEIFYNRAMSLAYLKEYQQSYDTLLVIIAVIIKLEGPYSYNLLPSLSLLSEVSSYLQQKTLSHQCGVYQQIIMNDISYSDCDIKIEDSDQDTKQIS